MSKSITVTLPNAVYDSLERHMMMLDTNLPSGVRASKSNYVSICIHNQLEKDGETIIELPTPLRVRSVVEIPHTENPLPPL